MAACVLKHFCSRALPYVELKQNELFAACRQTLRDKTDITTHHRVRCLGEAMILTIIVQAIPEKTIQEFPMSDLLISISIRCKEIGMKTDSAFWVLPFSQFWRAVGTHAISRAITERFQMEFLSEKKYKFALYSRLNMHQGCLMGVYKIKLECTSCHTTHRVFI